MIRYDFFWPAAELCGWGNARLAGDGDPLPPRLQDGVLHQRFVDANGERLAASPEEWYRILAGRGVERLWLLPHRWPVSGEVLSTPGKTVWTYGGHDDGYRTTLWRARPGVDDEWAAARRLPTLDEAIAVFTSELDAADRVRIQLRLSPYEGVRRLLTGQADEQVEFLPRQGYSPEARRLAEAAFTLTAETHSGWALDAAPDLPKYEGLVEHLDDVRRAAVLVAVNAFDPSISGPGEATSRRPLG